MNTADEVSIGGGCFIPVAVLDCCMRALWGTSGGPVVAVRLGRVPVRTSV